MTSIAGIGGGQMMPPPMRDFSQVGSRLINDGDTDGSGTINADELESLMSSNSMFAQDVVQIAGQDVTSEEALAALDTDGDGELSESELTTAISELHANGEAQGPGGPPPPPPGPPPEEAAQAIFSEADADEDGSISLSDFTSLLETSETASSDLTSLLGEDLSAEEMFSVFDDDGDGTVSGEEFQQVFLSQFLSKTTDSMAFPTGYNAGGQGLYASSRHSTFSALA